MESSMSDPASSGDDHDFRDKIPKQPSLAVVRNVMQKNIEENNAILSQITSENDKLKRELKEQSEAPSTESPGESGSVFFKEYYDELVQACAENDEARIAEHVHDGPELLRSAEIPCRIPQPQVTIADTQTIKELQSEVKSTKALLKTLAGRFGIESIDDMIS